MRRLGWLALIVLAGCGPGQKDLMPLEVGRSWTFHIVDGLDSRVESVKAVRPVAVDGVTGMELNGPLGISRFAWKNNSLVAQSTSNLVFSPGLPLLAANGTGTHWNGRVTWMGRAIAASADITQKSSALPLNSRTIDTMRSEVTLHLPSHSITLVTWFERGVGIVKQEQRRTNAQLDVGLDMIEGP